MKAVLSLSLHDAYKILFCLQTLGDSDFFVAPCKVQSPNCMQSAYRPWSTFCKGQALHHPIEDQVEKLLQSMKPMQSFMHNVW